MIIATRGSRLALWQAHYVQDRLREIGQASELNVIKTQGDRVQHLTFDKLEGKGFFTKEIEDALLAGEADIAVHSLKDLPTEQPEGLVLAALSYRATPTDVLLIHPTAVDEDQPLHLKAGARVGTSSARRKAQLRDLNPRVDPIDIRGNVPTRLDRARTQQVDAVLLAAAGLERLDLDLSDLHVIRPHFSEFVPAPGQGVMAIQCRADALDLRRQLAQLHHTEVGECTNVERTVLSLMEGGCSMPLGVYCHKDRTGNFHCHAAYAKTAAGEVTRVRRSQTTWAGLAEAVVEVLMGQG